MAVTFFKKNIIDLDNENAVITVTDAVATDNGQDFIDLMRNRSNRNGWRTTGSTDAANTTLEIDMIDSEEITNIFLVNHNLKAYTLKYWDGAAYQNFSTPVAETTNAITTTRHTFNSVSTTKIQLVITGTMTANDDKQIAQMIFTTLIGSFSQQVKIEKAMVSKNRHSKKSISGRTKVFKSVGSFKCGIRFNHSKNTADLALVETLFARYNPFLVWLCGGTTNVYPATIEGYRLQDIYLMDIVSEYEPNWEDGKYNHGLPIDFNLAEAL